LKKIALDGPAGSGKSTVAKRIANKLCIEYLDTGAMYRAVTLYFMRHQISFENQQAVEDALNNIQIDFNEGQLYLNQENVTEEIREPQVASQVSKVAAIKAVRTAMVKQQQAMATRKDIIMDGRDIGTVVLPDTPYKFFLTASIDARAIRRYEEMLSKGFTVSLDQIKADISKRDSLDMSRTESPLIQAEDAILVDTTNLNIEDVVELLLVHIDRISE
jgi:cytidylate kinase